MESLDDVKPSVKPCIEQRLVWAKLKYCPYWPARIVETPPEFGKSHNKKICVLFFGTKTYGFVNPDNVRSYTEHRAEYMKKKGREFAEAVKSMDDFIRDPIKFHANAHVKPIKRNVLIKRDPDLIVEDSQNHYAVGSSLENVKLEPNGEQKQPLNNGPTELETTIKDLIEEKAKIVSDLISVKADYQRTYFDLQKKEQELHCFKLKSVQMEQDQNDVINLLKKKNLTLTKLLEKKEFELEAALIEKEKLVRDLTKKDKEKRMNDREKFLKLTESNKVLTARLKQIHSGLDRNLDNGKATTIDQPKNQPSEGDHVYEVERLLGHKKIQNIRYFLVRWKNFDPSYDTWEPERNLSCPKIMQEYLKSNKLK